MANKFWQGVCGLVACTPALIAGTVHGTVNALNGKSFEEGFNETGEKVIERAMEFGDKHGDTITNGIIGAAAAWATKEGLEHSTHHPPHQHK